MTEKSKIKLPPRVVNLSVLADAHATPEEALLLLSPGVAEELATLSEGARYEIRDLLYELGRSAQNGAFPTIRLDLDLELEGPQDWCASVALEGHDVRTFEHAKASCAFAMGVREAVIQATSLGILPRSEMISDWAIQLGYQCEALDEIAGDLRGAEDERAAESRRKLIFDGGPLELNPEIGGDE